ncbi:ATP-binding cassette domain-containing protein [Achromobacter xylosoxidans]
MPQDVELFSGTVAENIARFPAPDSDGEVLAQRVIDAARMAGAHDMILALPRGYDTPIGTGGQGLSGGQRQRIALARALYGRPRLVVLDEPNASLDDAGEQALLDALGRLREAGATVVLVTHRPKVLAATTHLLLLRDGQAQRFGATHGCCGRRLRARQGRWHPPRRRPPRRATARRRRPARRARRLPAGQLHRRRHALAGR